MAEPGNALNLYEDRPHAWDAWDIDDQYRMCPVGALVVEHGEYLRTSTVQELRVRGKVGVSAVQLSIRLRSGSTRLDFRTTVDWKERHKLLRVCFPTAIRSDECSYETQYGFVRRPTHRNTSWDAARFEVCGHRWADLSERTRGVALLNDCKYGYSCRSGELGLSLLRAPTEPDPVADLGTHEFTYSLLPHQGDLFESSVRAEAAMLNAGVLSLPGLSGPKWQAPVEVSGEGLELAVVKASEDQGRGIIVRVVEVRGARAKGQITAKGCQIIPTDLMEWKDQDSASALESLDLDVGAFSIETFRILPA
jgi:alpha-mannosidase